MNLNPYFDQNFFSFFAVFFYRLWLMLTGQIALDQLASDEIQCFALAGLGVASALVGSFLVFRKMTMLANSLSHTILLGIVLAFILGSSQEEMHEGKLNLPILLLASMLISLLTVLTTEFLSKVAKLQEDASIGLVFSAFFALGIVLVNLLTRNAHIGAEVVMGNVDALHHDDLKIVLFIFFLTVATTLIFYRGWMITTFDPGFARILGFSTAFYNYFLMILVSLTVVAAFRAVGVLMVLTFITAPPLMARLYCIRFSKLLLLACFLAILFSLVGVALARHILSVQGIALSTAGVVVTLMGTSYLIAAFISRGVSRLPQP